MRLKILDKSIEKHSNTTMAEYRKKCPLLSYKDDNNIYKDRNSPSVIIWDTDGEFVFTIYTKYWTLPIFIIIY